MKTNIFLILLGVAVMAIGRFCGSPESLPRSFSIIAGGIAIGGAIIMMIIPAPTNNDS